MEMPRNLSGRQLVAILAVAAAITVGIVLAAVALFGASGETAPTQSPVPSQPVTARSPGQPAVSNNWAGYLVNGNSFSSVSGSWTVPSAKSSTQGYSAFWVGLGGSANSSTALEQIGTESVFVNGQARYDAWYELVPAARQVLALDISPGDQITARVTVSGTSVTVSLADVTTGQSMTKTLQTSNPDTSSAEWIAEAPTIVKDGKLERVLPLADFGKVTFSGASATASGHTGSISDSEWKAEKILLLPSSSEFLGPPSGFPSPRSGEVVPVESAGGATSSSLRSGGSAFSVSWIDLVAVPFPAAGPQAAASSG